MRRKMFIRLLIEYLIFAVASFLTISICIPQMVYNHTVKSESAAMYRQATYIASSYGSSIINGNASAVQSATAQLSGIDRYLQCEIMIVEKNGQIVADTYGRTGTIDGFDPSVSGNKYYFTGDFFGAFDHDTLTVIAPINSQYTLRGYVLSTRLLNSLLPMATPYSTTIISL